MSLCYEMEMIALSRKIKVFIAASLDGYIATLEDRLDWLFRTEGEGDNGYQEFLSTVDTVVMGRRTYNWIRQETGDDFPYREQQCYVFSRHPHSPDERVTFIQEPASDFAKHLRQQTGKDIWLVGGGLLLHEFASLQLVDEWFITVTPTLLGDGIPLFHKVPFETRLHLLGMRRFNQFVELHYATLPPDGAQEG